MRALLKLVESRSDARRVSEICQRKGFRIVHKRHGFDLDDEMLTYGGMSINLGGFGMLMHLNEGSGFPSTWEIAGLNTPTNRGFSLLSVYFAGEGWSLPQEEYAAAVEKRGGTAVDSPEAADLIVVGPHSEIVPTQYPAALTVSEAQLSFTMPRKRKRSGSRKTPTARLRGEDATLWKLLSTRNLDSIEMGLSLAESLDDTFDAILSGVEVADGVLKKGTRFTGTGQAQPYLDLALLGLLSVSPEGSRGAGLRTRIREITLEVSAIPRIVGFEALERLSIVLPGTGVLADLSPLGRLPALKELSIENAKARARYSTRRTIVLRSLAGLDAPELETLTAKDAGLESIRGLEGSSKLRIVDLSWNDDLTELGPLAPSAESLEWFSVDGCGALQSVGVLTGNTSLTYFSAVQSGITSVRPLSDAVHLRQVRIAGCGFLTSLDGLQSKRIEPYESTRFEDYDYGYSLYKCGIETLEGLPSFDVPEGATLQLSVKECGQLKSLAGIASAPGITHVELRRAERLIDVEDLLNLPRLQSLEVDKCKLLSDVSVLGAAPSLRDVQLTGCENLKSLPDRWTGPLERLNVRNCGSLEALGDLPESLVTLGRNQAVDLTGCASLVSIKPLAGTALASTAEQIVLTGCDRLTSLAGLEQFQNIRSIELSRTDVDLSAMAHASAPVEITVHLDDTVLPAAFVKQLQTIASVDLVISKRGDLVVDMSNLRILNNVRRIDLSGVHDVDASTVEWLVALTGLKAITVDRHTPIGAVAASSELSDADKIRVFQRALCRERGIPYPEHLQTSQKGTRKTPPPLLRDLRKAVNSGNWGTTRDAVDRIISAADPVLFDEVAEGTDPENVFTGSSVQIGTLFRSVKAADRPIARWALMKLLSAAPETAVRARSVRASVRVMQLVFDSGAPATDVFDLLGFEGVNELELSRWPAENLSCLNGLSSLTKLHISESEDLRSLSGLETTSGISRIELESCPNLVDFAALSFIPKVTTFIWDDGQLDLSECGIPNDLAFVRSLTAVSHILLRVDENVDLSPFSDASRLTRVDLLPVGSAPDLSAMEYVETLTLGQADDCMESVCSWSGRLPALTKLFFGSGIHDPSGIEAPVLKSVGFTRFQSNGGLASFHGINTAESRIQAARVTIGSFDGIQTAATETLVLPNVQHLPEDLGLLKECPHLRVLIFEPDDGDVNTDRENKLGAIRGMKSVTSLTLQQYTGSLSFLEGWDSLITLDLRSSGVLVDTDILGRLPSLATIYLRGSRLQRKDWPEELDGKLDYATR